jgi:hypothetical protein
VGSEAPLSLPLENSVSVFLHPYSMDLELDVFAAPDGRRHFIEDEEEFAHSIAHLPLQPPVLFCRLHDVPPLHAEARSGYYNHWNKPW